MEVTNKIGNTEELDTFTRALHLGLMVFGVLAWLCLRTEVGRGDLHFFARTK